MHVTILARYSRVLAAALGTTAAIVLAFALAGVAAADHGDSTHFQAESMAHGPFAEVVSEPSAFDGKALRYADPGRATRSVTLPSKGERVVIRARNGSASRSSVGLRVLVDGAVVGEKLISSTSYAYYSFGTTVPGGARKVSVEGYSLGGKDRAFLDDVRIVHTAPLPDTNPPPAISGWTQSPDGTITTRQATFAWDPVEPGAAYLCKLDSSPYEACSSPKTLTGLAYGSHIFTVKAVDEAGNVGLGWSKTFAVAAPDVWACEGTQVESGDDLDAKINGAPVGTTFCVHTGTYPLSATVNVQNGDVIKGEPGTSSAAGPATDPDPLVTVTNPNGLSRMFTVPDEGTTFTMEWLRLEGSVASKRYTVGNTKGVNGCINPGPTACAEGGTGTIIGAGKSGPNTVMRFLEMDTSSSNCVLGYKGKLVDSEMTRCDLDENYWGFQAGAMKTNYESEFARNFVHHNKTMGPWCDQNCNNVSARTNGFWVHDNTLVSNGWYGVRYEYAPMLSPTAAPDPSITSLIEGNVVAANGLDPNKSGAGIIAEDAQNVLVRDNDFGARTVNGVSYPNNDLSRGIQFADPATRTTVVNAEATANRMHGEDIRINGTNDPDGCYAAAGYTERGVYCHGNFR